MQNLGESALASGHLHKPALSRLPAHVGFMQGIWLEAGTLLSVGLDQCLRSWQLDSHTIPCTSTSSHAPAQDGRGSQPPIESASCQLQVLEPAVLCAAVTDGGPNVRPGWTALVAGRGLQLLGF